MVSNSVWWMCLVAFTKAWKYWEAFWWGTVVDHLAYESTSGFFALRRSPLKSPIQPSMMWEITEPTWLSVFAPFVLFSPLSLPWFCLPLVPQNPPTLRTTVLDVWNYDQQHAENCLSNVQVSDTSLVGCCPFSRKVSRPAIAKLATIREARPNPRVLANLLVLEEKCFAFVST